MIHYKTHSSVAIVKADKHLERVTAHSILMCTFLGSHEHPTARPMNSFVDICLIITLQFKSIRPASLFF